MDQKYEISLLLSGSSSPFCSLTNSTKNQHQKKKNPESNLFNFHSPRINQNNLLKHQNSSKSISSGSKSQESYHYTDKNDIIFSNNEKVNPNVTISQNMNFLNSTIQSTSEETKITEVKKLNNRKNFSSSKVQDSSFSPSLNNVNESYQKADNNFVQNITSQFSDKKDRIILSEITNYVDDSTQQVSLNSSYVKNENIKSEKNTITQSFEIKNKLLSDSKDKKGLDSPYFNFEKDHPYKKASPHKVSKSSERMKELSRKNLKDIICGLDNSHQQASLEQPNMYHKILETSQTQENSSILEGKYHNIDRYLRSAKKKSKESLLAGLERKNDNDVGAYFESYGKPPKVSGKILQKNHSVENARIQNNSQFSNGKNNANYSYNGGNYSDLSFILEFEKEKVAHLEDKLSNKENLLSKMKKFHQEIIKSCEDTQEKLQKDNAEKDVKLNKLNNKLKEYKSRLSVMDKENVLAIREFERTKAIIQEKDRKIDELEIRLIKLKNFNDKEKEKVAENVPSYEELKVQLNKVLNENLGLSEMNFQLKDEVHYLNNQIQIKSEHYHREVEDLKIEIDKVTDKISSLALPSQQQNNKSFVQTCYQSQVSQVDNSKTNMSKILDELAKEFETNYRNQDVPSQIRILIDYKKKTKKFIDMIVSIMLENLPNNAISYQPTLNELISVIKYIFDENKTLKNNCSVVMNNEDEQLISEIMGFLNVENKRDIISKLISSQGSRNKSTKSSLNRNKIQIDVV